MLTEYDMFVKCHLNILMNNFFSYRCNTTSVGGGGNWPRILKEDANNFFPNLRLYDQQTTNDTS